MIWCTRSRWCVDAPAAKDEVPRKASAATFLYRCRSERREVTLRCCDARSVRPSRLPRRSRDIQVMGLPDAAGGGALGARTHAFSSSRLTSRVSWSIMCRVSMNDGLAV